MMGKRMKERGPHQHLHHAFYDNVKKSRITLLFVENVPEYEEHVVKKSLGSEWEICSVRMDPRCLGLGCSRTRVFMVCWRREKLRWTAPYTLTTFLLCMRSQVKMNASHYFYKKLPKAVLTTSAVPKQQ